jgi:MSHA biogenesis protein MshG
MPVFNYTGRSRRGDLASGVMEGESRETIAARLFANGITPIEIKPAVTKQGDGGSDLLRQLGFGKPTTADLVMFTRQMYTITRSGIPLLRGMKGLVASTHNEVLRDVLVDILDNLEGGRELSGSFARHPRIFPTLYISLLKVGEETGTLEASFRRLAEYLQQDQDMRDRVKSAMRYPIIVIIAITVALGVLTMFVIPKFAPLFRALGDNIPMPTRIIMGVSNFARDYWYVIMGAIAIAGFLVRRHIATDTGRMQWDTLKLKLPGIGKLTQEATLARITRSLAIALNAGMPVIQTLSVIAKSAGNEFMAARMLQVRTSVERGEPLSRAATSSGIFTPLVLQMIAVGEETGDLPKLLDECAEFYEREVEYSLKTISDAIEPILIVAVGGMVLVLALGIFLPMWELIAKVGKGG